MSKAKIRQTRGVLASENQTITEHAAVGRLALPRVAINTNYSSSPSDHVTIILYQPQRPEFGDKIY